MSINIELVSNLLQVTKIDAIVIIQCRTIFCDTYIQAIQLSAL